MIGICLTYDICDGIIECVVLKVMLKMTSLFLSSDT